jgi:hypothetical protein
VKEGILEDLIELLFDGFDELVLVFPHGDGPPIKAARLGKGETRRAAASNRAQSRRRRIC